MTSPRILFALAVIACAGLMATALYFQHGLGLEPCPMCIFQRIAVISIGLICLVAALHGPAATGQRIYGLLITLVALTGLSIAGRQSWLQQLPPERVPDCGPGLEYMLEVMPLQDVISKVFRGTGDCAEVQWTLLGFSIPEWMLPVFGGFVLFGLFNLFVPGTKKQ
jgi:disulfide bond formation protein DsbB